MRTRPWYWAFAERHARVVRALLAAGCLALTATSEEGNPHVFAADPPPTTTELTPELRVGAFRLRVSELPYYAAPGLPNKVEPWALSLAAEAGYALWIKMKVRAGLVVRLNVARVFGDTGPSTLVAPVALASLTFN